VSWELLHGDCRDVLKRRPRSSVDAIVTSPPYADQRKYTGASEERVTGRNGRNREGSNWKNQGRRKRSEAPMLFAEEFVATALPPMWEALADHGSLMLNLGIVFRDGEESPYADAILAGARALGFKLLHRIVWHKPNGNTLSDSRFLRVSHEWIFWLAKSVDAYRGYDLETRTPHKPSTLRRIRQPFIEDTDDERYGKRGSGSHQLHPEGARPTTFLEVGYEAEDLNVIRAVIRAGVGGHRGIKHPAIMPLKVARHLVALSAPAGAVVVDPYAGSGTTGVAAIQLGRDFVGIEKEAGYLPECLKRLERANYSPTVADEQLDLLG
jgi:site-specific DNA-methyltransferase (adenine-specific)